MKTLNSFNNSTTDFKLEAEATLQEKSLLVEYKISDSKNLLNLPPSFSGDEKSIPRADGLWNDTCFELFLRPKDKKSYYEFNFSLKPAWNEYFFESYRHPQPPKQSHDILLKKIQWDGQFLKIELDGFNPDEKFEISLTAVLKEGSGAIRYMALKHAGAEPDFHHSDSFMSLSKS